MRKVTRRLLKGYGVAVLFLLYVPMAMMVLFSFNDSRVLGRWGGFTLRWYEELARNTVIWTAFNNSVTIALVTAVLSMVMGTLAAYALTRYRVPGTWAIGAFLLVPIIIPEVTESLAIMLFFSALGMRLSLTTVVLGHTAFAISFVYLVVRARLAEYDVAVDEAAQSLGANSVQTFFRITLPISLPAILAGTLLAFTISFDDYIKTRFTIGAAGQTLPMLIFAQAARGAVSPEIAALATLILAVSMSLAVSGVLVARLRSLWGVARRFLSREGG